MPVLSLRGHHAYFRERGSPLRGGPLCELQVCASVLVWSRCLTWAHAQSDGMFGCMSR